MPKPSDFLPQPPWEGPPIPKGIVKVMKPGPGQIDPNNEFEEYIEKIHIEPYSLITNNCYHKSWKVIKESLRRGKDADLITCPSRFPVPPIIPHFYAKVNEKIVDVAFNPELERIFGKGRAKPYFLPFNLTDFKPEAIVEYYTPEK